jgi:predicted PurR-regulated permease PerM
MDEYLPQLSERGRRWVRFFGLLAAATLLIWIALVLRQVLTPIVAALALAYILNPLVTWLEQRYEIKRVTSISIGLGLLLLLGVSLLFAGTVQVVQLAGDAPEYTERAIRWVDQTVPGLFGTGTQPQPASPASAPSTLPTDPSTAPLGVTSPERIEQPAGPTAREQLAKLAKDHGLTVGRSIISRVASIVSDVFYWASFTVLLPVFTFFFLWHFNEIVVTIRAHLPTDYRPTVVRVATTIDGAISNFFRGRLLVCLAVGTLTGLGWLGIGLFGVVVPYNLALGALAGVLNLVPFMSVLALPPALLLTYLHAAEFGDNWIVGVTLVLGVYMAVQAMESFLLSPVIESKASGLHPVTTVIALLIGGQLAGLLGMLLAIPITSTLKSLGGEYLLPEVRRLAGIKEPEPPEELPTLAEIPPPESTADGNDDAPSPRTARQDQS